MRPNSPSSMNDDNDVHNKRPRGGNISPSMSPNPQHRKKQNTAQTTTAAFSTMSTQRYDLAVIGGGSGGLAAAKEAAKYGKKVVVFDFVKPSTQGTKWGLGGTCVNVGCVPKKLMHYSGIIGNILHQDAAKFGWKGGELKHDWEALVETVQNHVHASNFAYRGGLRSAKVEYINALASFKDANTLQYKQKGQEKELVADHILIATGGRPLIPDDVPGAREFALTSDDIFSREQAPGKTLVVGASYIALECAGFLTEMGYDTTVSVRSILLRGFDRDCANKIEEIMRCNGTKFLHKLPKEIKQQDDGKLSVTFADDSTESYDTVMYATGRYADTRLLGLEKAGVTSLENGKFNVNDNEQTNVPNVYAIGDILQGRPELTPVAIKTGELLARRLFNGSTQKMNWDMIPTSVFTPVEYGACGLSEEDAIAKYGAENIETYLTSFVPLEEAAAHRHKIESLRVDEFDTDMPPSSLSKLVCLKTEDERVVGFHFVGPNAGEVTQGYAVALKCGAKKSDFEDTLSIHPTNSEAVIQMTVSRSSGENYVNGGLCGGGKCG